MKLTQRLEREKAYWLKKNPRAISTIAGQLNLTTQYVREVFWEKKPSRENHVERRLIERGAPGFKSLLVKAS